LLDSLVAIKSKEEVIGDIIGLLQSPAKRIISALLNNAESKGEEVAE
jgi:large subunit ribosomal protein L10